MKKISFLAIVIAMLISVVGCGQKNNGVIGSWSTDFAGSAYTYQFNEDKTGQYDAGGQIMKFTYEDDGKTLSILFEGNTAPMELPYKIEGNKLIAQDSLGNDITYTAK